MCMCMNHINPILESARLAALLPVVMGAALGAVMVVYRWVGAEWLDRVMYNSLVEEDAGVEEKSTIHVDSSSIIMVLWREVREGVRSAMPLRALGARFYIPLLLCLAALLASGLAGCVSGGSVVDGEAVLRSDRSYSCVKDGGMWVCTLVVEVGSGRGHPSCRCSSRGGHSWCECYDKRYAELPLIDCERDPQGCSEEVK